MLINPSFVGQMREDAPGADQLSRAVVSPVARANGWCPRSRRSAPSGPPYTRLGKPQPHVPESSEQRIRTSWVGLSLDAKPAHNAARRSPRVAARAARLLTCRASCRNRSPHDRQRDWSPKRLGPAVTERHSLEPNATDGSPPQHTGRNDAPRLSTSVVICVYTEARWDSLVRGVRALQTQTHHPDEIVIVCDHNDALLERATTEMDGVRVIANTSVKGLSGARNTGTASASCDVIAFLDDDAVPEPEWLQTLLAPMVDPTVVGVGGAAVPAWPNGQPAWFPDEFLWVVGCSYRGLPHTTTPVRNPIGCSMAFRRTPVIDAGGFSADLGRIGKVPLGCEETELAIRVLAERHGDSILYVPEAVVHHEVSDDRTTWAYFRARCYAEGLSKAAVSKLAGSGQALSAERTYVTRTLPSGLFGALSPGNGQRLAGLGRAAAILIGLGMTTLGYARGRLGAVSRA
jgi:GT2 family glycosyltransferase